MGLDGTAAAQDAVCLQGEHSHEDRGLPGRDGRGSPQLGHEGSDPERLARRVSQLSKRYPHTRRLHVVWDNWPNHGSALVRESLEAQPRTTVLPLPTYAPWLNPIEKLWRWLKQRVVHAHPWCDDFRQLRDAAREHLASLARGSSELLRCVGLST